jgi:hypothetical protein
MVQVQQSRDNSNTRKHVRGKYLSRISILTYVGIMKPELTYVGKFNIWKLLGSRPWKLSAGATTTIYGLDCREIGVRVPVWVTFFSSPRRLDWFWGPSNLLSNGYRGFCPRGSWGRGVKLTTHLQLLPRSRIRGSIDPPPPYVFIV